MTGNDNDQYYSLNDLAKAVVDEVDNNFVDFQVKIDDWDISGRAGRRKMKFNLKIIAINDKGRHYILTSDNEVCYENGHLIIQLPRKSLVIGVGND